MRLMTDKGVSSPNPGQSRQAHSRSQLDFSYTSVPVRLLLEAIGMMVSLLAIIPWARLRIRQIQLYLLALWRPTRQPISAVIRVQPTLRLHLLW